MELFKLMGTIAVDNTKANEAIDTTTNKAEGSESKISKAFGKVAKAGAAVATGTVAAGGAMFGFATKAAGATDRVDKMSQKIGISRKSFQELDFVCSQSGTSVDGLQMGMKTLTGAMDKAANGTKSSQQMFDKLGVSVTNSKGELRSQEDVFWDTIKALQSMDNQTEKARLATQLFGRSGSELMPMLNGASGSIEEMRKQAHDLGLVMSDDAVDAGVQFTDAIDQLQRSFGAVVSKIGVAVMPILMNLINTIRDNMPSIQSILSSVFSVFSKVVTTAVSVVGKFINKAKEVGSYLAKTFAPTFKAIEKLFMAVKNALQPLINKIKDFFSGSKEAEGAINFLKSAMEGLSNILTTVVQGITDFVNWLSSGSTGAEVFKAIIVGITAAFVAYKTATLAMTVATKAQTLATNLAAGAQKALNLVMNANPIGILVLAITGLVAAFIYLWNNCESFRKFWINLWNEIKKKVTTIFNAIKQTIQTVVNAIKSFVQKAFSTIKEKIINPIKNAYNKVKETFTNIKNAISDRITAAKTKVSDVFNGIKNSIKEKVEWARDKVKTAVDKIKGFFDFSGLKTKVKNLFDDVKEKITAPIDKAKELVDSAISKIKKLFPLKLGKIFDGIKLPHFKISGGKAPWGIGGKGKKPSIGIDWYAKAMNNPMILKRPTIFGLNDEGQLMGGGEAGNEVVTGQNTLLNMIQSAVSTQTSQTNEKLEILISMLAEYMPQVINNANKQIVLDTGVLAGQLAPGMDSRLGDINRLRERGR